MPAWLERKIDIKPPFVKKLSTGWPTECLFRDDAYLQELRRRASSRVTEQGGIVLDRTVFYATSGGQPGDSGALHHAGGRTVPIATAVYTDAAKTEIAHVPAAGVRLPCAVGDDGARRDRLGQTLRAACACTPRCICSRPCCPMPVTGGSVGEDESRLDFDIPEAGLDKDEITAKVNEMIAADAAVSDRWISDAELEANPGLVKTMSVKPPMGTGRVRLIEIAGLDLQPCGGTHVRATGEIGAVRVTQIEKKGKQNRRVRIALV